MTGVQTCALPIYSDLLRLILEAAQERIAAQRPGLVIPIAENRSVRAAGD